LTAPRGLQPREGRHAKTAVLRTQIGPVLARAPHPRAAARCHRHASTAASSCSPHSHLRPPTRRPSPSILPRDYREALGPAAPFTSVNRLSWRHPQGATRSGVGLGMWPVAALIMVSVTSHDVRLEINRKPKCALHSCIENLGNFHAFK
jgi:hypothetical protein